MRRALVLSSETARHPFRVHFVHTSADDQPIVEEERRTTASPSQLREDVSFFLLSYVSGLIIIFTMIA